MYDDTKPHNCDARLIGGSGKFEKSVNDYIKSGDSGEV